MKISNHNLKMIITALIILVATSATATPRYPDNIRGIHAVGAVGCCYAHSCFTAVMYAELTPGITIAPVRMSGARETIHYNRPWSSLVQSSGENVSYQEILRYNPPFGGLAPGAYVEVEGWDNKPGKHTLRMTYTGNLPVYGRFMSSCGFGQATRPAQ